MNSSDEKPRSRPVVPPIVLSSTFAFPDTASEAAAAATREGHIYTRWSNPTIEAAEERLADLEGAERCLLMGSGMAAISVALIHAARRGGTILVQEPVYGGTHEVCAQLLPGLGAEIRTASVDDLIAKAAKLPAGATIYTEVPANPTNRVADLVAIRAAAPTARILVDATFASPVNLRALEHGADLVLHSASKYLGGHHDLIAGAVVGSGPQMEELWYLRKLLGPVLDPAAAYRLWRGMETVELRVQRQSQTSAILASRLAEHPAVIKVHYPSLPSHPDHAVAARLLSGFGGVVSFDVGERASAVANALQRFAHGPSLGGTQSMVSWPAGVSHVNVPVAVQARSGITPGLLRLAVGLEDPEVLWGDLVGGLG
ncbi:MAG: cystathionine beta-lyase/cystathionine gamma-synthase [Myxococcota bacterium]|jgi:cystathionine beta-lyase/cystathionine gamma-synthase